MAQQTITGTAKNSKGEPLAGVNILVKGTYRVAVTNADGAFGVKVNSSTATLIFGHIGFAAQEVTLELSALKS